ncbi:prickle-like protein 2 [Anoplophora glabripennis]|uniref:prickle-like protein 2 n=1 Tax=Anoplophora glabripennis TaxID=217634 RepID=UPI000C78F407|nr:prickle-like protein 2 [Anoplophora glabripennis]
MYEQRKSFYTVDQYYSTLPSEEVPKLGSKGEMLRSQRIVRQLPKQDLSLSACKFVEPEYASSYQDFISGRNQVALDVGIAKATPPNSMCADCSKPIHGTQISVAAPRLGDAVWHPACFKCKTCDDLLVDLAYCVYEDSIYCERHYAEKMKPRCAGCDEFCTAQTPGEEQTLGKICLSIQISTKSLDGSPSKSETRNLTCPYCSRVRLCGIEYAIRPLKPTPMITSDYNIPLRRFVMVSGASKCLQ